MSTNHHGAKQHQANQSLKYVSQRLAHIIQEQGICDLIKISGLSKSMLYQYANEKAYPTLPKLALIAQECGVSLAWLFSEEGEKEKQASINNVPSKHQALTVTDDVMHPTIKQNVSIQYQPLKPLAKKKRWPDGLYVLTNQQGLIVRRVQWRESDDTYRVYGDNPHYPPQVMASIAPIGKVTAVIHIQPI
ncbi:LexA family transcriptional regulator [Vibrio parahaemolyticus]|uniref:LexA family transcriptional regulator n=1 Tax=Vibrio parahaemolyticus TaxID=670 RepID=A0A9Q3UES3_VIBPH|nr:LexA family transcriptional regulator [Vibrio parahaemolyticus]MCC3807513.1 LexA family transcriptional regulator [Vibrio parahaemolyticus]MCI9696480.1 LexA family transcriptional regulator [Vibrio parahaemolyticus]MCI9711056.1 LexA family transcriptional regulator [Vibrio parahaemolyticus]MCI9715936.1 LexA family transcriptional regulator [Vibrio parahaemolyticus]